MKALANFPANSCCRWLWWWWCSFSPVSSSLLSALLMMKLFSSSDNWLTWRVKKWSGAWAGEEELEEDETEWWSQSFLFSSFSKENLICGILGQVRSLGWSQVAPGPFFKLLPKLSMLFCTAWLSSPIHCPQMGWFVGKRRTPSRPESGSSCSKTVFDSSSPSLFGQWATFSANRWWEEAGKLEVCWWRRKSHNRQFMFQHLQQLPLKSVPVHSWYLSASLFVGSFDHFSRPNSNQHNLSSPFPCLWLKFHKQWSYEEKKEPSSQQSLSFPPQLLPTLLLTGNDHDHRHGYQSLLLFLVPSRSMLLFYFAPSCCKQGNRHRH